MTDKIKDGGFAFPQLELVVGERDGHGDAIEAFTIATGGMTLRDWVAGQCFAANFALLSEVIKVKDGQSNEDAVREYWLGYAKTSFIAADAWLAAREAR